MLLTFAARLVYLPALGRLLYTMQLNVEKERKRRKSGDTLFIADKPPETIWKLTTLPRAIAGYKG